MAEVRQPLLQGAGVQFNRIAGPGATPGALQRRDARPDQHRHRPGRLRGRRAEPGQRRGNGLLGTVLPVPEPRRGDRRPRQRPVDVAEDLHPLPHRRQGRRGRERGPGPRAILPLPQHGRAVAQRVVRHRGEAALPAGAGGHRRPADPSQGRADHRQGGLRLVRRAQRGLGAERGAAPGEVDRQAARAGIDRRQELPACPSSTSMAQYRWLGLGNDLFARARRIRQRLHASRTPTPTSR